MMSTAILLRAALSLVALRGMPMVSDAADYLEVGRQLASGDVPRQFYWPPGEPAVLASGFAFFGQSLLTARLLTIAMSAGAVVFTVLLGLELGGPSTARTAGWIAAVYPPSILLSGQTYAQHLASLCLAGVAYFAFRAQRTGRWLDFAAAGALLGCGALTRPSMISAGLVAAAAVLIILWHGGRGDYAAPTARLRLAAGAILSTVVALAVVMPVMAHNARAGAGWTISTNNERNLFLGNNPYTPDYKTSHLGQRSLDELPPAEREYLSGYYARPDARSAMRREAIEFMLAHPLRTALRTINRATSFWGFDYLASREIQRWRGASTISTLPLLALEGGGYVAVVALALLGMFAAGQNAALRAWLVAVVLAYQAPYAIAFSGGTYHFPAIPLLIPFAALAVGPAWAVGRAAPADQGRGGSLVPPERGRLPHRAVLGLLVLFLCVQIQYAWYAVAMHGS
jgi:hypothetical protein